MVGKKVGLLYLGLQYQLVKKFGAGSIISRKEFLIKVGKHYQLPLRFRPDVLKEMEQRNLLKRVNRDNIKILPQKHDLEEAAFRLRNILGKNK